MSTAILELDITLEKAAFQLNIKEQILMDGIWGIMGASGCGKTSLLRCLSGLESEVKGIIKFGSSTWQNSSQRIFVPPEKRNIGYIFQDARLFPHLSVMGNLSFAIKRKRVESGAPDFGHVVDQLGIGHLLGRSVLSLSGGEKQRVAIARTLLNGASLLLMDEPLAALDWSSKMAILALLRRICRQFKIPVVVVSHAPDEMARLVDNLLLIDAGKVTDKGRCKTVLQRVSYSAPLSIVEGTVVRHDETYSLTEVDVNGQVVFANQVDSIEGSDVRLVLSANEVSIFLDDVRTSSVQNRLSVVLEKTQAQGDDHVLLRLSMGEQSLSALITRKSMLELSLSIGQQVYACFKAADVDAT